MRHARSFATIVASSVVLGGCGRDVQSMLAPKGIQAEQIAVLAWLLFGFGIFVLAIVIAATWLAIGGSARSRRILAQENTVLTLGIAFPVVTLTLLLGYGVWLTRALLDTDRDQNAVGIEVVGEQWWWRVTYLAPDGTPVASANEIRIPVATPIAFKLKASDVIHSFWVPSLGGKVDMIPGRTTHLRLTAERPGTYRGQCAEYCGGAHALMALEVIAMPASEHAAWLRRAAMPARAPQSDIEQRGQHLFLGAGCGACHTVRGTAAAGKLGPDLTQMGARRSVGIDTMPLTHDNLVRFITDGQHVKPGNLMPEFRFLQPPELDALAAYLLSLKAMDADG
ncbi:cytochrome c oxidase subunit II [Bradyrhizobium sp. 190]|uniref:cytochrome c oxidase subunit II n=1 Tax=Bradyrhizobium sp. 190 TaxID=2782658 RepID=UPI001FF96155|nr:cytochrome c oxidase subunit II [Bradyrhizobium sp. 190]MCK1512182.1 cytochrome c oxidase subunit II [Bradyrhizobium sp. 190]